MGRYIQNYVSHTEGIGALKLQPPGDLSVPPLRTYTYIPVTGQIISRVPAGDDSGMPSAKQTNVATGSSLSTTPLKITADSTATTTPPPKGVKRKLQLDKEMADDEEEEQGADDDDDDVEDDAAAELEMLDQLEKASSSSKKKKKRTAKTTGAADGKTK